MSHTSARVLQYIVIISLLAVLGGAGYAFYQSRAAVTQKTASKDGLVGYWRFEENTGTSAGDMSGSGNTGTLTNGPTWVDGRSGKAVNFDGVNDYVSAGSPASLDDIATLTTCAWIYPETLPTNGTYRIIDEKTSGTGGWAFIAYNSGGTLVLGLYRDFSTYDGYWFGNQGITLNAWTHVCLTYDNSSVSNDPIFYMNSTAVGTIENYTPIGTASSDAASTFVIGAYTSAYYFDGSIDEVRIYNRILTSSEVATVYGAGIAEASTSQTSSLTNGLTGLWSFDGPDISGTTVYDRSGSGNNGTVSGSNLPVLGKIGQGFRFDAVGNYVDLGTGNILSASTPMTLSWWEKITAASGAYQNRFYLKIAGASYNFYVARPTTGWGTYGNITWGEDCGVAQTSSVAPAVPDSVGVWHHFVITSSTNAASQTTGDFALYVDGVSTPLGTPSDFGTGCAASNSRIGYVVVGNDPADAVMDDVRVYNRALSSDEVWSLYQLGASDNVDAAASQLDPLRNGLAAYWKFDENTGTSAADSSANGNTATLTNGPTWSTGRIGSGITFDGNNDQVTVSSASSTDNLSALTICAWVNPDATQAESYPSIVEKGPVSNRWDLYLTGGTGGTPYGFGTSFSNSTGMESSHSIVPSGQWTHLCGVQPDATPSDIRLYANGVLIEEVTAFGTASRAADTGEAVAIGYDPIDVKTFSGKIDEVRIYNRALSSDEIAKLYKTTVPDNPDTGLKAYYPFNGSDISGTTAYDRAGSNNGTLTNGPVPVIGKIGQGIDLDGIDDEISVADPGTGSAFDFANGSSITLSAWVKPDTFDGTYGTILAKEINSSSYSANYAIIHSNCTGSSCAFDFRYDTGSCNTTAQQIFTTSSAVLTANVWQHLAVTYTFGTAGSAKIYIDGAEVAGTWTTGTGSIAPCQGDRELRIGRNYYGATFDGRIDEIRVYNRALSATEVATLYNQGK